MSQRNPMNERYSADKRGVTKRSAASLKPKTKAAASVYVKSTTKTPKEKRAAQRAERTRAAELDRLYYNPPTPEYRKLRRIWWVLLGVSVVMTLVGMFSPSFVPETPWLTWGCIIPAYGCIIAAIWLDMTRIRKLRRAYQSEMIRKHPKEAKKHLVSEAERKLAENKPSPFALIKQMFSRKDDSEVSKEDPEPDSDVSEVPDESKMTIAELKAARVAEKQAHVQD